MVMGSTTRPSSWSLFNCKSQVSPKPNFSSHLNLHHYYSLTSLPQSSSPRFLRLRCCSSPGSPGSGESENRTILDAFFLGKALGEAVTERIESAVGEFLSTVGRLQAEQQKQIQDFQEDVLERAKRAKEKAAREALEEQGRLNPKSTTVNASAINGSSPSTMSTQNGTASPAASASVDKPESQSPTSSEDEDRSDEDSLSSIPIDE